MLIKFKHKSISRIDFLADGDYLIKNSADRIFKTFLYFIKERRRQWLGNAQFMTVFMILIFVLTVQEKNATNLIWKVILNVAVV